MLEGFGGLVAPGPGRWAVVVPGRVSAEVTLTRSHLVWATRVEFGEAHEGMGLQRGGVFVAEGVRRSHVPLLHEAVPAQALELGVGAARRGRWVGLAKQGLGGDRE